MSLDLSPALLLEALIAVLLVATIVYAVILERKLTRLRGDRAEMEAVIARLIEATGEAQSGLRGLRAHAEEAGQRLDTAVAQSRGRADELAFLIERAEAAAGRLERALAQPAPVAPVAPAADKAKAPRSRPPAREARVLKSLEGIR